MGTHLFFIFSWRFSFFTIGTIGVIFGILGVIFLREPKRGKFDTTSGNKREVKNVGQLLLVFKDGFVHIFSNKCTRWLISGAAMRFWSGYTVQSFAP